MAIENVVVNFYSGASATVSGKTINNFNSGLVTGVLDADLSGYDTGVATGIGIELGSDRTAYDLGRFAGATTLAQEVNEGGCYHTGLTFTDRFTLPASVTSRDVDVYLCTNFSDQTALTVAVNGTTQTGWDASGNTSGAVMTFTGVVPDVNDEIVITVTDTETGLAYIYLNGYGLRNIAEAAADTTPPTFSVAPAVTPTYNGGTVTGTVDETGSIFFAVVADGATAPSVTQVIAGQNASGAAALAAGSATNTTSINQAFSTLSASTAYDLYIVARDDESTPNVQATVTLVNFTTSAAPDTTAPSFSVGPAVSPSNTGGDFTATINETGDIFFVVVADGATAPSSTQVVAGQNASGAAALAADSVLNNTSIADVVTTLSPGTNYDVYFVARDTTGNLQASPVLVNFTTTSSAGIFTDYFSASGGNGALDGWTTYNGAALPNAQRVNGYYDSGEITAQGGTMWYFADRGRADWKLQSFPADGQPDKEYIFRDVGVGPAANPRANLPYTDANQFVFCGVMVHNSNTAVNTHEFLVMGHRGNLGQATFEGKTTTAGNSIPANLASNLLGSGVTHADVRLLLRSDRTCRWYYRAANSNDAWTAVAFSGYASGITNGGGNTYGPEAYVGIITYAGQTPTLAFRGSVASAELVGDSNQVSTTFGLQWNTQQIITADTDIQWNTQQIITADTDIQWNTQQIILSDTELQWTTRQNITGDIEAQWNTQQVVIADVDIQWNSQQVISADLEAQWNTRQNITDDIEAQWNSQQLVSGDVEIQWDVQSFSSVSATISLRWDTRQVITSDVEAQWNNLNNVSSSTQLQWGVLNSVSYVSSLQWNSQQLIAADIEAQWDVLSLSSASAVIGLQWNSQQLVSGDVEAQWDIQQITASVGAVFSLQWTSQQNVQSGLTITWDSTGNVQSSVTLRWTIQGLVSFPDIVGAITISSTQKKIKIS